MESQYFIYDGKTSIEMNLYNVRINHSGFVETPLWGRTNIQEETSKKRLTSYFYGVTREPIEFKVQFALADENMQPKEWTTEERYKIAKWLIPNTYKEFQTNDDLNKRYYAMITNEVNLNLMNTKGYIELTFRTNSPFAWSQVYENEFNLSNNVTTTIIQMDNKSNVVEYYRPMIEIELVNGETNVQLKNLTNGNKIFKFEGLAANEIVGIDCDNEIMKSNLFGNNPFGKFNKNMNYRYWLDLAFGVNQIEVSGKCIIKTRCQFPIAQ